MPMRSDPARPEAASSNLQQNMLAIVVTMLALGVGLAYLIDGARRTLVDAITVGGDSRILSRTLGGKELTIPALMFRHPQDLAEGFVERVELRLPKALGGSSEPVDITLLQRSKVRPSTQLLDAVYLHQFAAEELAGPPGLIGKPLKAAAGYAGETVWYDPISGDPFVAKCVAPVEEGQPSRCLRTVELSPTIAAVYSFDETLLSHWREFDAAMTQRLGRIGVF